MLQDTFRILIIDDDEVDRMRLRRYLVDNHTCAYVIIEETPDGAEGLKALDSHNFDCVLLDYNMPGENGVEILQKILARGTSAPPVIMQTVLDDEYTGQKAVEIGAQDYLVKGRFDSVSLCRSIRYAMERHRLLKQKEELVLQLQAALSKVKTLEGIIPICSSCKKVRDDAGYWQQVEVYVRDHSGADFTHSMCPECIAKWFPDLDADKMES